MIKTTARGAAATLNSLRLSLERFDRYVLSRSSTLTQKTGRRVYQANALSDFSPAFASIMKELSSQYSLGYYPRPPKHGERRRINVSVDVANVALRKGSDYVFTNPGSLSAPGSAKEKMSAAVANRALID